MFFVNTLYKKPNLFLKCICLSESCIEFATLSASFQRAVNASNQNVTEDQDNIEDKIVFNSKIKQSKIGEITLKQTRFLEDDNYLRYKVHGSPIVALKYFINNSSQDNSNRLTFSEGKIKEDNKHTTINLPYEKYDEVSLSTSVYDLTSLDNEEEPSYFDKSHLAFSKVKDSSCARPKDWMKGYNKYSEVFVAEDQDEEEDENSINVDLNYGTTDPNEPASTIPCGGCGAHLHCQDTAIPGYLPKEIFSKLKKDQLQAVVCQRCHFLQEYNTALSVNVDPKLYPELLSKIRGEKALVILVVDMTDFPCSIWPGIIDVIGPKRPLVVVGNKVDLLQDYSKNLLERAKEALIKQLPSKANIIHTALVSAKTGFGIENLITSLYNLWEYKGDVYLVGCTNVGKSTLFNCLLQSDYCKTKAVDLLQRATTAPWPGTTLNLLKFPIMRPAGWRLALRSKRLKEQQSQWSSEQTPQMITCITRTFSQSSLDVTTDDYFEDPFALPKMKPLRTLRAAGSGLDPTDPVFAQSKWLYDTPGVVTSDQIIDLLTTEELVLTLPQKTLVPRSFSVWPGQSLMVAGLGRLDYIHGSENIKMTVLAAHTLPITICVIADMDDVYQHYLGSEVLGVPIGGQERLDIWPGLQAGEIFSLKGIGWRESCADVVLSSAGWIAVTAQKGVLCQMQAWTPRARGIHVRIPPVLPFAVALKGQRMYKSQAYGLFNKKIKK